MIDGDGICRPDQKTAVYTYTVDVDPNYSGRQDYAYEFVGDKGGFEQDFDLVSTQVVVTDPGDGSGSVDVKEGSQNETGTAGTVVVGKGVKQFEVTVILAADQKLTGDETLQLSVGGATSDAVGIRGVADCGEGAINWKRDVDGDGICRPDQKTAVYTYTVDVDPNYSGRQDYAYEFVGDKGGFEQDFDLVSTQQLW